MLNPFPSLLVYGFFAPTLLRVVVAGFFFYIVYDHIRRRDIIAKISFPLVGRGAWVVWVTACVYVCIASILLVGYGTQIAALIGLLLVLKSFWIVKTRPTFYPLSLGTFFLLFIILSSLLLTGAGMLAVDLPL